MKAAAESAFVFSFKFHNALFHVLGKICCKLVLAAPSSRQTHLQEVFYQLEDSEEEVKGHIITTDAIEISPETKAIYHHFQKDSVTFYLPKGLCEDNADKTVTLQIVVQDQLQNNADIGGSSFLLYPRREKRKQASTRKAEAGEEDGMVYQQCGELTLVKNLEEESISILIGKLKYEATLRLQDSPSPLPSTPSPLPSLTIISSVEPPASPEPVPKQVPEPEPEQERMIKQPTPLPTPPVVKFDLPKPREPSRPSGLVAPVNQEEIIVIVHAASGLTPLPNSSMPNPYVLGKIQASPERDEAPHPKTSWQSTCPTLNATPSPMWGDMICCKVPAAGADDRASQADVLRLKIVDKPSKIEIVSFELPVSLLQPFHFYHLDLVQTLTLSLSELHLYVTIYRKLSSLPTPGDFSYCGLEVRLLSLNQQVLHELGALYAVTKIVPDYLKYRDAFRERIDLLSLEPTAVEFPAPHPTSFLTSRRAKHQGYAQLWPADVSDVTQPKWNHSFVFCDERELASMFVSTAALIVELYDINSAFDGVRWHPHKPIGFAVVLLDNRVYNALTNDGGKLGVRIPNVPLQACVLPSQGAKTYSISLFLRLLTSQVPDSLPSVSNLITLPTVDGFETPKGSHEDLPPANPSWGGMNPEPACTPPTTPPPQPLFDVLIVKNPYKLPPMKDDELPSSDAVRSLLDSNPQDRLVQPGKEANTMKGLIPTRMPLPSVKLPLQASSQDAPGNDQTLLGLIDTQQREVNSYRQAMKRMGQELIQLQDSLSRLETENSRLRQQASMYEDTTRAMVTDSRLEGMSKAELLENLVTLKRSLSKQVSETANYREKLLHAQNELIKHNDREKKRLEQQETMLAQSKLLQERQEKVRKLALTCREQEKALEKMDKALKTKLNNNNKQGVRFKEDSPENAAMVAENARLKAELEHLKALSNPTPRGGSADEAERLKMQFMVERAEGRVLSLEKELMEKAKEWGKERASLSFRLDDHQRSQALPPIPYFDRRNPPHEYPDPYSDRSYGSRRPRQVYGTPTRLSPLY